MPWFVLSNGRIVGGGVQTIHEDEQTPRWPAGEWACWRALIRSLPGPEKGRTALSEVKVLDLDPGAPSPQGLVHLTCPECEGTNGAMEKGDYICVFCRYQDGK
jgi:hypothetical protein